MMRCESLVCAWRPCLSARTYKRFKKESARSSKRVRYGPVVRDAREHRDSAATPDLIALDSMAMLRVLRHGDRFTALSHSSPVIAARIFDAEKRSLTKSNVASVTAV